MDKRRVVAHDGFEILCTVGHHPVQFPREDRRVARDNTVALEAPNDCQQLMYLESVDVPY